MADLNSIMDIINVPFGYVISWSYHLTHSYVVALLFFAIIMKLVLFPLGIKQQKNMVKQASLRPKEQAIRKKYAGRTDKVTQQKMQEEIMHLYSREHFNPAGGCLPLLLQLPIIWSLYSIITNPLSYICKLSTESVALLQTKINELLTAGGMSTIDKFTNQIQMITKMRELGNQNFDGLIEGFTTADIPNFTIFNGAIDLSAIPMEHLASWLILIPILTFVVSYFTMKLTRKFTYAPPQPEGQNAGASMKIMNLSMPLISVFISCTISAAIGVYWMYQNILGLVQQVILSKMYPIPQFTEDDYKAAERELGVSSKKEKKKQAKVCSLHHIDDEDFEQSEKSGEQKEPESKKKALPERTAGIDHAELKDDNRDA